MKYSVMKFFLTVLFCVGMLMNVNGQNSWTPVVSPDGNSPHEGFQPFSDQTAYGVSLNPHFLFLVNDEKQQVIFNPARAAGLGYGFIQTSFTGGASDNFNTAVLFPAKSGSWFLTLGGAIDSDDLDRQSEDFTQNFNVQDRNTYLTESTQEQYRSEELDSKSERSQAEFRLLKVFGSEANEGRAVGIFGGFSTSENISSRSTQENYVQLQNDFRGDTLYGQSEFERDITSSNSTDFTNNKLFAGIEYYSWSESGDLSHKLYVHKNDYVQSDQNNSAREEISTVVYANGESNMNANNTYTRSLNRSESQPWQFRYDLYKNVKLNVWGDDYLFANLQFVFGFGDQDVEVNARRSESSTNNDQNVSRVAYDYTVAFEDPITNFIGGRFSTGYAITLTAQDFSVLTGLNPFYELSYESINRVDDNEKQEVDITQQMFGAELPVLGMFDVSSNFKLWGGASIKLDYSDLKNEIDQTPYQEISTRDIPEIETVSQDKQTDLTQRVYAGLGYQHDSGFGINANARGNWSNLNNWFISFNYQF